MYISDFLRWGLGWGRLAVSTIYNAYGAYAPYDAILSNTIVKFGVVALLVYKQEKVVHYSVLTWYDHLGIQCQWLFDYYYYLIQKVMYHTRSYPKNDCFLRSYTKLDPEKLLFCSILKVQGGLQSLLYLPMISLSVLSQRKNFKDCVDKRNIKICCRYIQMLLLVDLSDKLASCC